MPAENESLRDRLRKAGVLDEFMELMFAHEKHYDELLEELEKWGISSSLGALSRFKASHKGEWSMQRALREQQDFLAKHGANLDEVTRQMTAVNIFNIAANPNTPTKDVLKMRDQEIKLAELKQTDRRLALLEAKVKDTSEAMENDQLTDEEKVARWKQVFGR